MFTFNIKKKTVNEVLKEIDDRIKKLKGERDEMFSKLEGYAKAKETFYLTHNVDKIESIEKAIYELELLRISVEYM